MNVSKYILSYKKTYWVKQLLSTEIKLEELKLFSRENRSLDPSDPSAHRGRRPWQNRISILLFFRLNAQFSMYKNTLGTWQVLTRC